MNKKLILLPLFLLAATILPAEQEPKADSYHQVPYFINTILAGGQAGLTAGSVSFMAGKIFDAMIATVISASDVITTDAKLKAVIAFCRMATKMGCRMHWGESLRHRTMERIATKLDENPSQYNKDMAKTLSRVIERVMMVMA